MAMQIEAEAFTGPEPVSRVVWLPEVSQHMPPEDARDLRWYLTRGGIAIFSASSFGKLLERAELFAGGEPCAKCGGEPGTLNGGCGFVPSDADRHREQTEWEKLHLAMMGIELDDVPRPLADQVCGDCNGQGWRARFRTHARGELTARPTGSSKSSGSPGVNVADVSVMRLGRVSGRLDEVSRRSPESARVLVAYYSREGDEMNAVVPLVPAGKTLLRRKKGSLDAIRWLANESEDAKKKQDFQRLALLTTAGEQAKEAYRSSVVTWNQVVASEGKKIQTPRYVRTDEE